VPQLFPPCRLRFNMSGIRSKKRETGWISDAPPIEYVR
jgi:hypothetical protein